MFVRRKINLKKQRIHDSGSLHWLNGAMNEVGKLPNMCILSDEDFRDAQVLVPVVYSPVGKNIIEVLVGDFILKEALRREVYILEGFEVDPMYVNHAYRIASLACTIQGTDTVARLASVHLSYEILKGDLPLFREFDSPVYSISKLRKLGRVAPNSICSRKKEIIRTLERLFSNRIMEAPEDE